MALFRLVRVPVKVIVVSEVPSPALKLSPPVPPSVTLPLVAVSVTCSISSPTMTLSASSGSEVAIWLPFAAEKTRLVSSLVLWATGTVLTGASLTALTVIATGSVSLMGPPGPKLPRSLVRI